MTKQSFTPEDVPQTAAEWCVEIVRYAQSRLNAWEQELGDLGYSDLAAFKQGEMFVALAELSSIDDPEVLYRKASSRLRLVAEQLRVDYPAGSENRMLALGSDTLTGFEQYVLNDIEFANWTNQHRYSN